MQHILSFFSFCLKYYIDVIFRLRPNGRSFYLIFLCNLLGKLGQPSGGEGVGQEVL